MRKGRKLTCLEPPMAIKEPLDCGSDVGVFLRVWTFVLLSSYVLYISDMYAGEDTILISCEADSYGSKSGNKYLVGR